MNGVLRVVMISSNRAIAAQSTTKRTRQSSGTAASRGTNRFRSMEL